MPWSDEDFSFVCRSRLSRSRYHEHYQDYSRSRRKLWEDAKASGWDVETLKRMYSTRTGEIPAVTFPKPAVDDLTISRWDAAPRGSNPSCGFNVVALPEDSEQEEPIEQALKRQVEVYKRTRAKAIAEGPRVIQLESPGPIALVHFGDPHLDDNGCNWPAVLNAVETVARTPHMYAGNVGDTVNNWVGRLISKYGHQQATIEDGWRYARWLMLACPWLYVVGGNHDQWNGGMPILQQLTRDARVGIMAPDECRLEIRWPGGKSLNVHARHDFKGNSIYNKVHGLQRAALWGQGWADLYVCGHRHEWAEQTTEYEDGRVRTLLRVRGFKHYDEYARSLNFYDHKYGQTLTTILDPMAPPTDRVRVIVDVNEAAEILTWLRQRAR